MKRADRAKTLIDRFDNEGAGLEFIHDGNRVHVRAAPEDWPLPAERRGFLLGGVALSVALGDCWSVCGLRMSRNRGGVDNGAQVVTHFADGLLCQRCHAAFAGRASLIFESNVSGSPERP